MTDFITIARPYARAAFDFAVEHNNIEQWQKMLAFAAEVSHDQQMNMLMTSDLKPAVLADLFIGVGKEVFDAYGANLIRILAQNHRLPALPDVYQLFSQYCLERDAIVDVEVISATELSQTQLSKISTAVEQRLSKKVNLKCKIDASIISGFIIRTGDLVIDSSIRGRLNRLSDVLQS